MRENDNNFDIIKNYYSNIDINKFKIDKIKNNIITLEEQKKFDDEKLLESTYTYRLIILIIIILLLIIYGIIKILKHYKFLI